MKGNVDKSKCIGCGLCESICPEVFQLGNDGLAEASPDEIASNFEDCAEDARLQCPVDAITVE